MLSQRLTTGHILLMEGFIFRIKEMNSLYDIVTLKWLYWRAGFSCLLGFMQLHSVTLPPSVAHPYFICNFRRDVHLLCLVYQSIMDAFYLSCSQRALYGSVEITSSFSVSSGNNNCIDWFYMEYNCCLNTWTMQKKSKVKM